MAQWTPIPSPLLAFQHTLVPVGAVGQAACSSREERTLKLALDMIVILNMKPSVYESYTVHNSMHCVGVLLVFGVALCGLFYIQYTMYTKNKN